MTVALAEAKAALRQEAARRRDAAKDPARDRAACERLLSALGDQAGRVVSGFLPIRSEIDPRPAMKALHAAGARLCVPVVMAKAAPLAFREWTPGGALTRGNFDVEIPAEGEWLTPETLIVPLLAWDRRGRRLGYGGGFYDLTLARLRATGPVSAVGFAFAAQETQAVPAAETDAPLDRIVTELEVLEIVH